MSVSKKKFFKDEPIPELVCLQKPTARNNDGVYAIKIPIKYMIKALEAPAAFFEFRFIGIKYKEGV